MKKHILHTAIRPSKGLALLLLLLLGTWGRMQAQVIVTIEIAESLKASETTEDDGITYKESSGSEEIIVIEVYFDDRVMTTSDLKKGGLYSASLCGEGRDNNGFHFPCYHKYFYVKSGDKLEFEITEDEIPTNISFGCVESNEDPNQDNMKCDPLNFSLENLAINTWRGTNDFYQYGDNYYGLDMDSYAPDEYYELVYAGEYHQQSDRCKTESSCDYDSYWGEYYDQDGNICDPNADPICLEYYEDLIEEEEWIRFRYKWNYSPELNVVLSSNTGTPVEDNIINCEEEVKLSIQYIDCLLYTSPSPRDA